MRIKGWHRVLLSLIPIPMLSCVGEGWGWIPGGYSLGLRYRQTTVGAPASTFGAIDLLRISNTDEVLCTLKERIGLT